MTAKKTEQRNTEDVGPMRNRRLLQKLVMMKLKQISNQYYHNQCHHGHNPQPMQQQHHLPLRLLPDLLDKGIQGEMAKTRMQKTQAKGMKYSKLVVAVAAFCVPKFLSIISASFDVFFVLDPIALADASQLIQLRLDLKKDEKYNGFYKIPLQQDAEEIDWITLGDENSTA